MHGFDQWAARHAAIFGLNTDRDPAMFAAWEDVFDRSGYTAAELNEATDYLAATPGKVPLTRPQNLDAINARVRERRLQQYRHNEEAGAAAPESRHALCDGGTGFVEVPHLKNVRDGHWTAPWYTMVVYCTCHVGSRKRDSLKNEKHRRGITLEEYEGRNPNWREQMEDRKDARKAMDRARAVSVEADRYGTKLRRAFGGAVGEVIERADRRE